MEGRDQPAKLSTEAAGEFPWLRREPALADLSRDHRPPLVHPSGAGRRDHLVQFEEVERVGDRCCTTADAGGGRENHRSDQAALRPDVCDRRHRLAGAGADHAGDQGRSERHGLAAAGIAHLSANIVALCRVRRRRVLHGDPYRGRKDRRIAQGTASTPRGGLCQRDRHRRCRRPAHRALGLSGR